MKNKFLFIPFFLLFENICQAQELPSIQTDRPDQTECPFITPKGYFQLENGFSYEVKTKNSSEITAPTILTKYGINDHFELRLITEYSIESENLKNISGISPMAIGFKTKLWQEKGIIPTTSLIGHLHFPKIASAGLKTNYYAPAFRFTMQHTLTKKQTLSYNLGAEWDGITAEPAFIYTLTTGYSFSEKISGYVEFYGFIPQINKPDHRFDAGLNYLFNPNHQLDLSGGFGLSATSPDYFVSLGYSFRFKI